MQPFTSPAAQLRTLLAAEACQVMPCCFDALSARLVERDGFPLTLLSYAAAAMQDALVDLAAGRTPERMLEFAELRELVGFDQYDAVLQAHAKGCL